MAEDVILSRLLGINALGIWANGCATTNATIQPTFMPFCLVRLICLTSRLPRDCGLADSSLTFVQARLHMRACHSRSRGHPIFYKYARLQLEDCTTPITFVSFCTTYNSIGLRPFPLVTQRLKEHDDERSSVRVSRVIIRAGLH